MSKSIKQRAAEESFNDSMSYYNDLVLTEKQRKIVKKICLEMYDVGYSDAVNRAQDMIDDVLYRLG